MTNKNNLYAGVIRSLGGWERFINLFDNNITQHITESKNDIIKESMLCINGRYVLDVFIENNYDDVIDFITKKNKSLSQENYDGNSDEEKQNIIRILFIDAMFIDYKYNFSSFEEVKNPREDLDPLLEGITHINTYTKSVLHLGKSLSNLANISVVTTDGEFKSLEGYWYWKITGGKDSKFKSLSGFDAKKEGSNMVKKGLAMITSEDPVFQECIKEAIRQKIKQNPDLLKDLIKSTLPIRHYYYHQGTKDILSFNVIDKSKYDWQTQEIERIREVCQRKMVELGQLSGYPPAQEELKTINKIRFK